MTWLKYDEIAEGLYNLMIDGIMVLEAVTMDEMLAYLTECKDGA